MLVRDKMDGEYYAMKAFGCGANSSPRMDAKKELASTKLIDSPFANRCHYAFRTNAKLCLILDWFAGKYLGWGWPDNQKMEEEEAKIFMGSMALGLLDIHKKGIVHFDLHSANLNTDEKGYPLLIDFGCSQTEKFSPTEGCNKHGVGWSGWHVPELQANNDCGNLGDWYMFGHFIYACLNGHKLMGHKAKQHCQPDEDDLSDEAKDIIDRLTVHDP